MSEMSLHRHIDRRVCARDNRRRQLFNLLASSDAKGDFDPASPLHELETTR